MRICRSLVWAGQTFLIVGNMENSNRDKSRRKSLKNMHKQKETEVLLSMEMEQESIMSINPIFMTVG